jgi:hypothetical protein
MIRTKNEILNEINSNPSLLSIYNGWEDYQQKEFLEICTGAKGVKILYDSFFKEVFNVEYNPERLSNLLSCIMKKKVRAKIVLPNDNSRLGDELSLVITDIVVELEDGTIANVEVQKIGYKFTGERASCYSADLLLREYKRVRDEKKSMFSYKDIASVYTIIFMEDSPREFRKYIDTYIHYFNVTSDTGIELNMLQNFIFIPLDVFMDKLHNEGINGDLDAWLTFLGCDEPEYIIKLIQDYPYFKPLYDDIYNMCLNMEGVMNMFSKELQILDRNTVKYMIDELQEQLDSANEVIAEKDSELAEKDSELAEKDSELAEKDSEIAEKDTTIAEKNATIVKLLTEIDNLKKQDS